MNIVFFVLVLAAVVCAGFGDVSAIVSGVGQPTAMAAVGTAAFEGAKSSVTLAISLAGAMTLFLGLMKVVDAAGGLDALARLIRPVLVRLFPDVPATHPAMGAIVMNIAANVLGLGNAATPFGIKAMQELDTLNKHPGTATNAMVLFLAINTSGVAVLPTGVMALRAAAGSNDPAAIFIPTLVASAFNTVIAVLAAKGFSRLFPTPTPPDVHKTTERWIDLLPLIVVTGAFGALVGVVALYKETASAWIIPTLILGMLTVGVVRGVKVYEVFIEGARDGFSSAMRIIPYLVAILTAVGMLRASGAMDWLVKLASPAVALIGMPPEVLPLALLRPLSGSGAFALTGELTKTYGPDTLIGQVAGTMQGTTETTFYVLAVYFGAVNIIKTRHAVPTGLVSDISGVLAAVAACHWLIG
ncbi:MAG: nucleoside recognition domain-containing protein [Pseudomonadota bacterium]|nr:nucleoside recognition domain-containing protein [Pseudomonadota bacterium]